MSVFDSLSEGRPALELKMPRYYSPSQLGLFRSDRREYFLRYLCKMPRQPQTKAMALGGVFDCFCKEMIALRVYGRNDVRCGSGGEHDLDFMIDHAIDSAMPDADRSELIDLAAGLFERYRSSGHFGLLLKDVVAGTDVQMEQTVYHTVKSHEPSADEDFTVLGKPDLSFWRGGVLHVYDWKVNGMWSKAGIGPLKDFVRCSPRTVASSKVGVEHKNVVMVPHASGTLVNAGGFGADAYALQLATYGLALGGRGSIIAAIEQVSCKPVGARYKGDPFSGPASAGPKAVHFVTVCGALSLGGVEDAYRSMHRVLSSGHIFDDVSRGESDDIVGALTLEAQGLLGDAELMGFLRG